MQNRYVGDVGDYGKYGMLRFLCGSLRLGIIWYLVDDESHNKDGMYIGYLKRFPKNHKKFRTCDPTLYKKLRDIVDSKERDLRNIKPARIFRDGTIFYDAPLGFNNSNPQEREGKRKMWFLGALKVTAKCDVVFVDPDNGMRSKTDRTKTGCKYVFLNEIEQIYRRGQSVIVYHHLGRIGKGEDQIKGWVENLKSKLSLRSKPIGLWYHRGAARAYFIIPAARHKDQFERRAAKFLNGPWGALGHFTRCDKQ